MSAPPKPSESFCGCNVLSSSVLVLCVLVLCASPGICSHEEETGCLKLVWRDKGESVPFGPEVLLNSCLHFGSGHDPVVYPHLAVYSHELPDRIKRIWSFCVGGEIPIWNFFKCFSVFLWKSLSKILSFHGIISIFLGYFTPQPF